MSANNGVIRIGRKGLKKFAIGAEDDERALPVFEIDVVVAFQRWIETDNRFRELTDDRSVPLADMPEYHKAAVDFVESLGGNEYVDKVTKAEALDVIARLRECYDEVADFFQPKSRDEPDLPDTSEVELRFSEEAP